MQAGVIRRSVRALEQRFGRPRARAGGFLSTRAPSARSSSSPRADDGFLAAACDNHVCHRSPPLRGFSALPVPLGVVPAVVPARAGVCGRTTRPWPPPASGPRAGGVFRTGMPGRTILVVVPAQAGVFLRRTFTEDCTTGGGFPILDMLEAERRVVIAQARRFSASRLRCSVVPARKWSPLRRPGVIFSSWHALLAPLPQQPPAGGLAGPGPRRPAPDVGRGARRQQCRPGLSIAGRPGERG